MLFLTNDTVIDIDDEPDFAVVFTMQHSLLGKTFDLTKPLDKNSVVQISAISKNSEIYIAYADGKIDTTDGSITQGPTVTGGTLTMTRSGDKFTVKLSVTLSDGRNIAADWEGTATKMEIPE